MDGWHFLSNPIVLRDGSPVAAVGEVETYDGAIVPCTSGLHLSVLPLDALRYAPGVWVRRVRAEGVVVEHTSSDTNRVDKLASSQRRVLSETADATRVLHLFAIWCADRALNYERDAGREPDSRSWEALAVKRRWLDGAANNGELAAAWAAAWDVWDGAWDAWDGASAAAEAAGRAAARTAAEAARAATEDAEAAAEAAAWAAAVAAGRAAVAAEQAAWDAGMVAAWDAAEAAERAAQNAELEARLLQLCGHVAAV